MKDMYTSEDAWTAKLAGMLGRRDDVVIGIGDDAAVVRDGTWDQVYTTDAVVEGIHFAAGTEPERIGHKMVGRLLSDLAAMGATPEYVLINLVVPSGCPASVMDGIYAGAEKLAASFGVSIIGGDTIQAHPLSLHGFAGGRVPRGKAVLRSGARAGDGIYVTGRLGGSIGGKHLDFIPRVREGVWLREGMWATSMMDLSDGLARDLPRICRASGTGVELNAAAIPVNLDLEHALSDGEDYELLFTVPAARQSDFAGAWAALTDLACTPIGRMTGEPADIKLILADGRHMQLGAGGFDHLRSR